MRRRARGQAVAEFVLGLLVFVTILLFGIHFAEVGFLAEKLHEAESSALWDSTAFRSYQFGSWADSSPISARGAQVQGQARYADWDGRASTSGSAPRLVMTRTDTMQLNCDRVPAVAYPLARLAPALGEASGVACRAEGDLSAYRIPTAFAEGAKGFFKASHNTRAANPLHMCGTGRANGSTCPGQVSLLLGDDALTDLSESTECALATSSPSSCGNGAFYATTLATFDQSMRLTAGWAEGWTGRPEAWARNIAPGLPGGRITGFYLSFRGDTSGFGEPVETGIGGGAWQTSPMDATLPGTPYRSSYNLRRTCEASAGYCFLGRYPCN